MNETKQKSMREVVFVIIQYVTSLGLVMFQIMTYPFIAVYGITNRASPSVFMENILLPAHFFLPVLSVIGIVLAIICIMRGESVVLSCIGLILNCIYLLVFLWIFYLVVVMGLTA